MKAQKDRHLEAPGEANRDKHINFLAEENGDVDQQDELFDDDNGTDTGLNNSDENDDVEDDDLNDDEKTGDDNGFFTDDDNELKTAKEKEDESPLTKEKVEPLEPDSKTTLGDRITVDSNNEDILTPVKDDNADSYANEK